jgi:hypothetical protein
LTIQLPMTLGVLFRGTLLSWLQPQFMTLVQRGIDVNPEEALQESLLFGSLFLIRCFSGELQTVSSHG